jgi:hypothetical protein
VQLDLLLPTLVDGVTAPNLRRKASLDTPMVHLLNNLAPRRTDSGFFPVSRDSVQMISHQQTLSFLATLNYRSPGREGQDHRSRSHKEPHANQSIPAARRLQAAADKLSASIIEKRRLAFSRSQIAPSAQLHRLSVARSADTERLRDRRILRRGATVSKIAARDTKFGHHSVERGARNAQAFRRGDVRCS